MRLVLPLENELYGRLDWFVWMRSITAVLVAAVGVACWRWDIGVPGMRVVVVGASIAAYNIAILLILRRFRAWPIANAHLQISLDWVALTLLMHATGGMNSPALMFFIFHVIFAALLIPGLGAFIHALTATFVVGVAGYAESTGLIGHIRLVWADQPPVAGYELLVLVGFFGFVMFASAMVAWVTAHHLRVLEQDQADLQQELASAVRQLELANRELVAMDEQKSLYTRTVTHQLRSPLSAIQSLLRVLIDGYGGALEERVLGMVNRVEQRVIGLIETVSDLLSVAEFEFQQKRGPAEPVDLAETVARLIGIHAATAQLKRIEVHFAVPPGLQILAGSDDMDQALDNLIENAVKYTPEDGDIFVEGAADEGGVRLVVRDTGIGIPPESLDELFKEFYRAPNAKEYQAMGTGLGLVIVKRSIERWGGAIAAESDGRTGTTFIVTFPNAAG